MNASTQEFSDRSNIDSTVSPMASVTTVVNKKGNYLILERDVLIPRWR